MRFRMLETIREFALERLAARPDYLEVCRRRTLYYVGVAEAAEPDLRGGDRQVQWFEVFENELGNLSAALEWAFSGVDRVLGARLAGALTWFWWRRGYVSDGLDWLKRGLDLMDASMTDPIRARLLLGAGILEWALHNRRAALEYLNAALALFRQLGDERQAAWTLIFRAVADIGDSQAYQAAAAMCDEGLALLRRFDDRPGMAQALNIRGELTRVQGDYPQAKQAYEACMHLAQEIGDQSRAQMMLGNLGFIALHERDYAQAMKLFTDGLLLAQRLNSGSQTAISLAGIASAVAAQGQWLSSAKLMAAAAAINTRLGIYHPLGDKPAIDQHVNLIRSQLSAADFEAAWADGSALSAEAAVQFAWSLQPGLDE
jgi:tetratricopeptide (TPR) repeat protein